MPQRVTELHCIMPLANISSVLQHGILSYERAAKLKHRSVAMPEIQDRRDKVQVPGGYKLHQYANLYFHARNPMMYKRQEEAEGLCVLRVSSAVLSLESVVISDQNASSDYARFYAPTQLHSIPLDWIYARDWTHPDRITYFRQKAAKCAEILVPNAVPLAYLQGAYVVNDNVRQMLTKLGFHLPITINPDLFFR